LEYPDLQAIDIGFTLIRLEDFKAEANTKTLPTRKGLVAITGANDGVVSHGDLVTKIDGKLLDSIDTAKGILSGLQLNTKVTVELSDFYRNSKGQGVWRGTRKVEVNVIRFGEGVASLVNSWKTDFLEQWRGVDRSTPLITAVSQQQLRDSGEIVGIPTFQYQVKDGKAEVPTLMFSYLGDDHINCKKVSIKVGGAIHEFDVKGSTPKLSNLMWSQVFAVPVEGKVKDAVLDLAFGKGEAAIMLHDEDEEEVKTEPVERIVRSLIAVGVIGYNEDGGENLWELKAKD